MTTQPVDATATAQRISRTVRAVMAARDVRDDKALAEMSGVKYDTLLRRLNGKPWFAHELLAVAAALEVDVQTLIAGDPDGWFPRAATAVDLAIPVTARDIAAPKRTGKSAKRRDMVYNFKVEPDTLRSVA